MVDHSAYSFAVRLVSVRSVTEQKTSVFPSRFFLLICLLILIVLVAGRTYADELVYEYDELGQLLSITTATGETAQYEYDVAGNLLQVTRTAAGKPIITDFTPNSGPVGTPIKIFGANFASSVAGNAVKFNGTAAVLTSASPTLLNTSVPAGAKSGKLTVATATGTALSAQSFLVSTNGGVLPPSITGFTPKAGPKGTAVTISGKNFDPAPNGTVVTLNDRNAQIMGTANNASLTVQVPEGVSSGRWKATTTAGQAISTSDFIVLPSGWLATDLLRTYRLNAGQTAVPVTIDQAGKAIALVFENQPGFALTLRLSSLTTVPAGKNLAYSVYSPTMNMKASGSFTSTAKEAHLPVIEEVGTITVLIDAPTDTTGSFSALLSRDTALVPNGSQQIENLVPPGESSRLTFFGRTGQTMGLALYDATQRITCGLLRLPTGNFANIFNDRTIYNNSETACHQTISYLPMTGIYSVIVKPADITLATSFKALLSNDLMGALALNVPKNVSLSRQGQNVRLTFNGVVGQNLGLGVTNVAAAGGNGAYVYAQVSYPYGIRVSGGLMYASKANVLDIPTLSTTGIYTVLVDPEVASSASLTLTLSADMTGVLPIDGAAQTITVTIVGQTARLTFSGLIGQNLGFGILDATQNVRAEFYKPNDSHSFATCGSIQGRCDKNLSNLPLAGDYTVVVTPEDTSISTTFKALLSSDVTGSLTLNTPKTVNITRMGQNARLTFSGTAGQNLRLAVSSVGVTGGGYGYANVTVYNPGGSSLISKTINNGQSANLDITTLPSTGTYTIFVDPLTADNASLIMTLQPR